MSLMIILLCISRPSRAQALESELHTHESTLFQELAGRGEIHIDRREAPQRRDICLERRQVGDSVVPTTIASTSSTSATAISSSEATITSPAVTTSAINSAISTETKTADSTSGVSTSTAPSVTVITTPLPTPFDTSLGSNFTSSSCPQFFSTFLSNSTFQSCIPISLLLQNSNSFFRAQRSFTLLTQTLDAACNAPVAICSPLLTSLASQLIEDANCGQDYRQQNPLVVQAYAGLIAYEPVYKATCLQSETTKSFCFTQAVTNSTNSADFYPYYTAIGLSLPQSASPTCSQCLKDTMQIFAGYAKNAVQPLSRTYLSTAAQIDKSCGSQFVNTTVNVGSVANPNGATRDRIPTSSLGAVLAMTIVLWFAL